MNKMIRNEWLKLRYNRMVIIFALVMFGISVIFATVPIHRWDRLVLWDYGIMAGIEFLCNAGGFIAVFMTAIAAGMFTQEYSIRTLHNAISCGVSRRKYILVKISVYIITCFLIQMVNLILYTVMKGIIFGWISPEYKYSYPHLELVAVVASLGGFAALFAWLSVFALLANLFRSPAAAMFAGVAFYYGENLLYNQNYPLYGDPLYSIIMIRHFLKSGHVLTPEFAALSLPCLVTGGICFSLTYLVFLKKDMN